MAISEEEFSELQIRLFCVEDMSPKPSKLITAFESKVPFFRGHDLGVTDTPFQLLYLLEDYELLIVWLPIGVLLQYE